MTKAITLESVIEQFRDALVDGWMFFEYEDEVFEKFHSRFL